MRAFDADVSLMMGYGTERCEVCHGSPQVIVQLPWPGEKPTKKYLCKSCLADVVEAFFNERGD